MNAARTIWPRLMKLETAASYCDMSATYFKKQMEAGFFPPPVFEDGRTKRFDRNAIDRALDTLSNPQQTISMGDRRL